MLLPQPHEPADLVMLAERWPCALLLGSIFVAAGTNALADDASRSARRVLLMVPDREGARIGDHAARTIASHIRPTGAIVEVHREPETPLDLREVEARSRELAETSKAVGVFWVVSAGGEVVLRLYAASEGRLFERHVTWEDHANSASIEAVAVIAGAASGELLDGGITTMIPTTEAAATTTATSAPPAPAPVPPLVTTASAELTRVVPTPIAWEPRAASTDANTVAPPFAAPEAGLATPDHLALRGPKLVLAPVVGFVASTSSPFALTTAVASRATRSFEVGLGYEVMITPSSRPGYAASIDEHPVFLAASYALAEDHRWDFAVGGRFVADVVTRRITHDFVPERDAGATDVRWSLGPTAELGFRVLAPLRIGLLAGVDAVLNPPSSSLADRILFITGLRAAFDVDLSPSRTRKIASNDETPRKK